VVFIVPRYARLTRVLMAVSDSTGISIFNKRDNESRAYHENSRSKMCPGIGLLDKMLYVFRQVHQNAPQHRIRTLPYAGWIVTDHGGILASYALTLSFPSADRDHALRRAGARPQCNHAFSICYLPRKRVFPHIDAGPNAFLASASHWMRRITLRHSRVESNRSAKSTVL